MATYPIQTQIMDSNLSQYLVFYGFAKLTKKVVRKRSIVIQYANTKNYNERQRKYIEQKMHIVHTRYQTQEEVEDAQFSDRSWTKYEYFVDSSKWQGDLDAILKNNYDAEENHVCQEERQEIKEKLKSKFNAFYIQYKT
jgi:hypothetical protein